VPVDGVCLLPQLRRSARRYGPRGARP